MRIAEIDTIIRELDRIEKLIPAHMMRDGTREARAFLDVRDRIRSSRALLIDVKRASRDVRVTKVEF